MSMLEEWGNSGLSKREFARSRGIPWTTFRHILERESRRQDSPAPPTDGLILKRKKDSIKDENGWHTEEWVRPSADDFDPETLFDTWKRFIGTVPPVEQYRRKETKGVSFIYGLSDAQIGKGFEVHGGTEDTLQFIRDDFEQFLFETAGKGETLFILDGGDIVENTTAHTKLDMELPEQVYSAAVLMMGLVRRALELFNNVVYVAVNSNHGEYRGPSGHERYNFNNDWGLVVQRMVECALPQATYVRPDPHSDWSQFGVEDLKVALTHGHRASTGKFRQWALCQAGANRVSNQTDLYLSGHYHTPVVEQVTETSWHVQLCSPDPGSSWYTRSSGESSARAVTHIKVCGSQWWLL